MALTLDFVFEGFRLIGKKPMLFLSWCLFYILISAVSLLPLLVLSGSALLEFISMAAKNGAAKEDPTAVFALLGGLVPGLCLTMIIAVIGSLVFRCAVYRSMLRPSDPSPAYLRLGSDEGNQFLLMLLLVVVAIGLEIALGIGAAVVIGLSTLAHNNVVQGLVVFVTIVAVIVAFIWFFLRISLAGVSTFDKGKLDLFGSMKLTKGNVWTLLGGYIILFLLLIILNIVVTSVFYLITLMATGFNMEPLRQAANPDFTRIMSVLGPVFIVQVIIGILMSVFAEVAVLAASIAAYKTLTTPKPASPLFAESSVPVSPDTL